MAGDHPAFFGSDPEDQDAGNPFDRALAQAGRQPSGIPADLIPYLEEADAPSDEETDTSTQDAEDAEETERSAALRALVEHSLLLGPDPSVLAELDGEELEDIWSDDKDSAPTDTIHSEALDRAADAAAIDDRVTQIYTDIVARAPEHRVQPSIDRVQAVLDILGDPQNSYPSIHITGTNGKTSTARMIDAVLTALGMRVGRFTSPHLETVRERISIAGQPITPQGSVTAWDDVAPYIAMVDERSQSEGGPRLSFFEVFTVMAYAAFADAPVDAAVIEVGMGGKWDATNTITADVSVIMPIDLDHQKWLGASIEEIAREKAGIIKPRQTVVIASQPQAALDILLERAAEVDAIVRLEGRDFEVLDRQLGVGGQMVTIKTPSAIYEDIFVPLLGLHQAHNAAAALVAVEALMGGRELDGRTVEQGFMSATSPGRLQVVRTSPTVVVDAAHNPAGARSLRDALEETFDFTHVVAVFAAMADKDVEGMLAELEPSIEHVVITALAGERAMPVEDLRAIAVDVFGPDRVDVREDLPEAIDRAVELTEASLDPADTTGIVVFGSIVLAGDVTALLRPQR